MREKSEKLPVTIIKAVTSKIKRACKVNTRDVNVGEVNVCDVNVGEVNMRGINTLGVSFCIKDVIAEKILLIEIVLNAL